MAVPYIAAPSATQGLDKSSDIVAPVAPITLNEIADGEIPVPDSAFDMIDAVPPIAWRPELLKYQPLAVSTAANSAIVRSEPGTEYDKLVELRTGTSLHVLAQANGWYQARLDNSRVV
jgi:uncharacterized protein YgiM (DUF1202 family)